MRFAAEALDRLGIVRQIFRKEFQSDGAVEPGVFSLVNYTHPARTKFLYDAVVRNGLANHRRRRALSSHPQGQSVGSSEPAWIIELRVFRLSSLGGRGDANTLSTLDPSP